MRLETVPLVLGALFALVGLGLLIDAWAPDDVVVRNERRRRVRHERDRFGEVLLGLGVIAMAAALIGRDTWRYSILTVIVGSALLLWGTKRNVSYIRGAFTRGDMAGLAEGPGRLRIR